MIKSHTYYHYTKVPFYTYCILYSMEILRLELKNVNCNTTILPIKLYPLIAQGKTRTYDLNSFNVSLNQLSFSGLGIITYSFLLATLSRANII